MFVLRVELAHEVHQIQDGCAGSCRTLRVSQTSCHARVTCWLAKHKASSACYILKFHWSASQRAHAMMDELSKPEHVKRRVRVLCGPVEQVNACRASRTSQRAARRSSRETDCDCDWDIDCNQLTDRRYQRVPSVSVMVWARWPASSRGAPVIL